MNAGEFVMVKRVYTRTCIYFHSVFSSCEHTPKAEKGKLSKLDGAHIQLCPADLTTFLVSTSYMAIDSHVRKGRD